MMGNNLVLLLYNGGEQATTNFQNCFGDFSYTGIIKLNYFTKYSIINNFFNGCEIKYQETKKKKIYLIPKFFFFRIHFGF